MELSKRRAAIYPYAREFAPIFRHKELLGQYEIVNLISPSGWGISGKDASQADGGRDTGMTVSSDIYESINCWDTLIIANVKKDNSLQNTILKNIESVAQHKKDIVCTLPIDDAILKNIKQICIQYGVLFSYYCDNVMESVEVLVDGENIEEIDTPVVFVAGLTENSYKFEIELSILEELIKDGYKVSMIGSRQYCELFGAHSFPNFMYNTGITEKNKILMFNRYVRKIEKMERPDLFIIGIPGGLMPFNKTLTNNFGIIAFLVSQAVSPDYTVVSVLYDDIDVKYFKMLNNSFKYKYGFEIDCFNMAVTMFDAITSIETRNLHFNFLDHTVVDEIINAKYSKEEIPVINILNSEHKSSITSLIIEKLSSYAVREQLKTGGRI